MLIKLQNRELYSEFISNIVNCKNNFSNTLEGNHLCEIPSKYISFFNSLNNTTNSINEKDYIDISNLFEELTNSVYVYTFDNTMTTQRNLLKLLPIILDSDTYGILVPLPIDYNLDDFRSSSACYMNLTNPLSILDTHSNNRIWGLFSNRGTFQVFIFKYDSSKYDNPIDNDIKNNLYSYLKLCCQIFYDSKVLKIYSESKVKEEHNIFATQVKNGHYVEIQTLNVDKSNNSIKHNYLTYSDIIVNNSVAPHYAIWEMYMKRQYLEGVYIKNAPMFSPNINPKSKVVCTGKYNNTTPEGLNTLIVSNLQSAFTKYLLHKNYFKYWIDINKLLAVRWLESLLDIVLIYEGGEPK